MWPIWLFTDPSRFARVARFAPSFSFGIKYAFLRIQLFILHVSLNCSPRPSSVLYHMAHSPIWMSWLVLALGWARIHYKRGAQEGSGAFLAQLGRMGEMIFLPCPYTHYGLHGTSYAQKSSLGCEIHQYATSALYFASEIHIVHGKLIERREAVVSKRYIVCYTAPKQFSNRVYHAKGVFGVPNRANFRHLKKILPRQIIRHIRPFNMWGAQLLHFY